MLVRALLAGSVALILSGRFASPTAAATSAPTVSLDLGVPIPIAVYGYLSSGDGGGGGGLTFLGAVGLEAALSLTEGLAVAVWLDFADIHGRDGDATADIYFASAGAGLRLTHCFGAPLPGSVTVTASLGPGVLASGIVVDEDMRLDTWSLGGRARLNLGVHVADGVALGLAVALGVYAAPLDEASWFNRSLGGTRLAVIAVSLVADL